MSQQPLVFTDLDGSLLDHFSYSHEPADKLLAELEKKQIPVIACTSKTRAELLSFREEINNHHPFIAENGAAVFIPEHYFNQPIEGCSLQNGYWVKSFCQPRQHWLDLIDRFKVDYSGGFVSFAQSSIADIMDMTGLNQQQAELASQREYGEPLRWFGSDEHKQQFCESLTACGANILMGGRFLHVTGKSDKGLALQWLKELYQKVWGKACHSIAIGDSGNDIAMLEVADSALIIASPVHAAPEIGRYERLYYSKQFGPLGWAEGLASILLDLLQIRFKQ